jgi:hypothetical protein
VGDAVGENVAVGGGIGVSVATGVLVGVDVAVWVAVAVKVGTRLLVGVGVGGDDPVIRDPSEHPRVPSMRRRITISFRDVLTLMIWSSSS